MGGLSRVCAPEPSDRRMYGFRLLLVHTGLAAALAVASCVGSDGTRAVAGRAATEPRPPTVRSVTGDWDDVEAAVIVGAAKAEVAILWPPTVEPDRQVYELLGVAGEPGRLEASLAEDGSIVLTCSIGRFGNPAAESRLVRAVAQRLRDLHGRDYAPLRP
jgi:hypothetical protein